MTDNRRSDMDDLLNMTFLPENLVPALLVPSNRGIKPPDLRSFRKTPFSGSRLHLAYLALVTVTGRVKGSEYCWPDDSSVTMMLTFDVPPGVT